VEQHHDHLDEHSPRLPGQVSTIIVEKATTRPFPPRPVHLPQPATPHSRPIRDTLPHPRLDPTQNQKLHHDTHILVVYFLRCVLLCRYLGHSNRRRVDNFLPQATDWRHRA
jgi:hypothetical protein